MISAESLAARLAGLDGIGRREDGIWRLAWTEEDAASRRWFEAQAAGAGLSVKRDPAGNLWACPDAPPPWPAVGSHLDSVRGGGRFDGPLGVACGFEIAAAAARPVAVISFADEEGARFNTPTFGSKALAGRLDLPAVLERRDDGGATVAEAMAAAAVDANGIERAPEWLERLSAFVEIHIDQSLDVDRDGLPVAVVSALAERTRLEVDLRGRADHAGTTPRAERRDALAAAARLIVAADEVADPALTVTTARILVEPNAATTIAEHVRLWVDGRTGDGEALEAWVAAVRRAAEEIAARSRVQVEVRTASRSAGARFDPGLRARLRAAGIGVVGRELPEHVCFAGHDAGVISEHVPAAMLLVRNRTGVSHSPAEEVSLEDAAVAARVALAALERPS